MNFRIYIYRLIIFYNKYYWDCYFDNKIGDIETKYLWLGLYKLNHLELWIYL